MYPIDRLRILQLHDMLLLVGFYANYRQPSIHPSIGSTDLMRQIFWVLGTADAIYPPL